MARAPLGRIDPLGPDHDRSTFSCGVPALDHYLRELAGQDMRRGLAVVYVLTPPDQSIVTGYYTLSSLSITLPDMPVHLRKRLPRYPHVPATLIGRLAVDQEARRSGARLGEHLMMDALNRCLGASRRVASFAVVVDVVEVEPDPIGFYLRYGFEPLPDRPRRLILPMETVRKSFG